MSSTTDPTNGQRAAACRVIADWAGGDADTEWELLDVLGLLEENTDVAA